ncbi:MAG: hypothetical protein ACI8RD_008887 [Bacillariaceae sp.]|jgi:hypothetical protein
MFPSKLLEASIARSNTKEKLSLNDDQSSEWKPEHFPHKMYDLLEGVERKGYTDIVSWLGDGKSFKIYNQTAFEETVMPLYFSGMSSYKSFRRQLNLYGIYQHRHRPSQDANAYSHEYLIRGHRNLCDLIGRKKANPLAKILSKSNALSKNGKKSSSSRSGTGVAPKNKGNKYYTKKRDTSIVRALMDPITAIDGQRQQELGVKVQKLQQEQQSQLFGGLQLSLEPKNDIAATTSTHDLIRRNILMKSIYDDESSTRPNPIDYNNIQMLPTTTVTNMDTVKNNMNNRNRHMFQAFMGQYWEDLPNNLSSTQVVSEIIVTFQQLQEQQQQQQQLR